jgi:hypothetical protein
MHSYAKQLLLFSFSHFEICKAVVGADTVEDTHTYAGFDTTVFVSKLSAHTVNFYRNWVKELYERKLALNDIIEWKLHYEVVI